MRFKAILCVLKRSRTNKNAYKSLRTLKIALESLRTLRDAKERLRTLRNAKGRLRTLDSRTLWDALGQCPFFRTVSHVEVTASHREGDGIGTGRRR